MTTFCICMLQYASSSLVAVVVVVVGQVGEQVVRKPGGDPGGNPGRDFRTVSDRGGKIANLAARCERKACADLAQ
jgi:hypothetical protein